MASNPETDIHTLWQEQPTETQPMSLDEIRTRAQRFDTKTRRWRNVGAPLVILLVIANAVEVVWPGQHILERTGDLLTIAAFLYVSYEYRKHRRLASIPEGVTLTSCIEGYRAQLTHERNLARQSGRYVLPFVPGVTLSLLGRRVFEGLPTPRTIGVAAFGVALFLGIAWWNTHTARTLQREIDVLDAL